MSRTSQISYELIRLLGTAPDIRDLLDIGYKYLNNPIHLTDLTGRLLCSSRHDVYVDDIWENIEANGYIDFDRYQSTCRPNVQKILKSSRPFIISDAPGNVTLLVCGLKTPRHFRANLIVIENERPFAADDEQILSMLATSLCTILDSRYPDNGRKVAASDYLICDLLDTPKVDIRSLWERSKIVAFFPKSPMQILTVCNSKNITSVPILNMTRSYLEELFAGCRTVIHNNRTVTILNQSRLDGQSFTSCGIVTFLEKYGLTASLSRPFGSLPDIYEYYMQTLYALEYGSIIHPNHPFYYYEDYTLYRCLDDLKAGKQLCHPCIRRLQEYDAEHKTDYTRTLYAYITQLRSIRDAAALIHVHYNTMKYRLARLQSLIDISLEDAGTFALLYLSFKAMELSGIIFNQKNEEAT